MCNVYNFLKSGEDKEREEKRGVGNNYRLHFKGGGGKKTFTALKISSRLYGRVTL
jgi:hypothetical protein